MPNFIGRMSEIILIGKTFGQSTNANNSTVSPHSQVRIVHCGHVSAPGIATIHCRDGPLARDWTACSNPVLEAADIVCVSVDACSMREVDCTQGADAGCT